jgi:hypothetical protein
MHHDTKTIEQHTCNPVLVDDVRQEKPLIIMADHYCPANELGAAGKFFQFRELLAI